MLKILKNLFSQAWYSLFSNSWRTSRHWRNVRKQALIRDNFKCAVCSSKTELHVHHLNGAATHKHLRFELTNLVTLCRPHHMAFHDSLGGTYAPCTKNDYLRWKRRVKKR